MRCVLVCCMSPALEHLDLMFDVCPPVHTAILCKVPTGKQIYLCLET